MPLNMNTLSKSTPTVPDSFIVSDAFSVSGDIGASSPVLVESPLHITFSQKFVVYSNNKKPGGGGGTIVIRGYALNDHTFITSASFPGVYKTTLSIFTTDNTTVTHKSSITIDDDNNPLEYIVYNGNNVVICADIKYKYIYMFSYNASTYTIELVQKYAVNIATSSSGSSGYYSQTGLIISADKSYAFLTFLTTYDTDTETYVGYIPIKISSSALILEKQVLIALGNPGGEINQSNIIYNNLIVWYTCDRYMYVSTLRIKNTSLSLNTTTDTGYFQSSSTYPSFYFNTFSGYTILTEDNQHIDGIHKIEKSGTCTVLNTTTASGDSIIYKYKTDYTGNDSTPALYSTDAHTTISWDGNRFLLLYGSKYEHKSWPWKMMTITGDYSTGYLLMETAHGPHMHPDAEFYSSCSSSTNICMKGALIRIHYNYDSYHSPYSVTLHIGVFKREAYVRNDVTERSDAYTLSKLSESTKGKIQFL